MSDTLAIYLHDHLAGAKFAIGLLEHLRDSDAEQPVRKFAQDLLISIEEDRAILQRIADQVNSDVNVLKEATAWLTEKVSRVKLRLGSDAEFGLFESLETLSLGILGKLALWRTPSLHAATHWMAKSQCL